VLSNATLASAYGQKSMRMRALRFSGDGLYTPETYPRHNARMPQLLLIDDDLRLASMVGDYLRAQGFDLSHAPNGEVGLTQAEAIKPDLMILDLMMPGMDGLEVCRRLRTLSEPVRHTPVLMLTAKGDPMERVIGLELGADDYMAKPFEPRELLARIKAILRRQALPKGQTAAPTSQLIFGSLEIDRDARIVRLNGREGDPASGREAELTSYQFDLLVALAERAGRVLTREQIMEAVRGRELEAFDRSIDVHMGRIRAAIEADVKEPKRILTVRGVGYVFAKQQD
jgi:DNA-binding response OmpR family regulator